MGNDSTSPLRASTVLWTLPFVGLLAFFALWWFLGNCWVHGVAAALFVVVTALCGLAAFSRERVLARFERGPSWAIVVRDVAVLAVACVFAVLALELPWNDAYWGMDASFARPEALFVALVIVALYFAGMRHGALCALAVAALALVGLAEHFVILFKGNVFQPSDLYALGTAAAVSGGYRYYIDSPTLVGLACAAVALAALAQLRPRRRPTLLGGVACALVACALGAYAYSFAVTPVYADEYEVEFDYWSQVSCYRKQGFFVSFMAGLQDLPVKAPEGYSPDAARDAQAQLASLHRQGKRRERAQEQFAEKQPSVIAVMNETFADLSIFDGLGVGYAGPSFFKSAGEGVLGRGSLAVPAFGGGTCNTEFEFLTGNSLTFLGPGRYPYSMYNLSSTASLARQLKDAGYATTAIHPNIAANWNRDRRYAELGFDSFLSIEDFEGAPTYHNGVSDAATYDRILELLECDDAPQFVFDVTMQNHSGYDTGNVPVSDLPGYAPDGLDADLTAQLNEYLACIGESDRALKSFVKRLSELDRPVVLVFFGDHHPSLSNPLNEAFPGKGDTQIEHDERIHQTSYLIWANYEIAESGRGGGGGDGDTAVSFLGAELFDMIGAPLTDYQLAQLGVHESVRSLTLYACLGKDGLWRRLDELDGESVYKEVLDGLSLAEHLEFGSKVS